MAWLRRALLSDERRRDEHRLTLCTAEGMENDFMKAAESLTGRESNDESGREAEARDRIMDVTIAINEKMMEDGGRSLSSTRRRATLFLVN